MNLAKSLCHGYEMSTKEAFDHFLLDLNPITLESLGFCFNITVSRPSKFYLSVPQPDQTPLSNERDNRLYAEKFESVIKDTAEENIEIQT